MEDGKKAILSIGDDVSTFDRVFISGKTSDDVDKNTTLIYGYKSFDQFVQDYVNVICTAYQFLKNETESEQEEVMNVLEEITLDVFESIKNGDYTKRVAE